MVATEILEPSMAPAAILSLVTEPFPSFAAVTAPTAIFPSTTASKASNAELIALAAIFPEVTAVSAICDDPTP